MEEEENSFNYELALAAAGIKRESGDDDHAQKSRNRYRESFTATGSTINVGPDGTAYYTETDAPFQQKTSDRDPFDNDVEDALVLGTDTPKSFDAKQSVHENLAVLDRYTDAVSKWKSGFPVASDADVVAKLQAERIACARYIRAHGLVGSDQLKDVGDFLAVDFAWISRPDPKDGEYGDYVRQRNLVRQRVFHDEKTGEFHDRIDSVATYARATAAISFAMVESKNIEDHYEFLSVRQEAVAEHFNNPRFIAEVGLYDRNKIDDELLVDLDRSDLKSKASKARSVALADIFAEGTVIDESKNNGSKKSNDIDTPTYLKIDRFQNLRETGRRLAHEPDAIIRFSRLSIPREVTNGDGEKEVVQRVSGGQLEFGLQALDNKAYSPSVMTEWLHSLSPKERREVKNEPVALFRKARETFERDYDRLAAGKSIVGNHSLAASFAVMERSAAEIHSNYPKYNKNGQLSNAADQGSLALFSKEYRRETLDRMPDLIDEKVMSRIPESERNNGDKSGTAIHKSKGKSGEEYHLDLGGSADSVHIEVADGNHLRLSNSKEDAEAGKFVQLRLEGLTVPAAGQQTKNGKLDAGAESKGHLEALIARFGRGDALKNMGLAIELNKNGETVLNATIESGESLSQRMIHDGYGLPSAEGEGSLRREHHAKVAESQKRGIWKEGFPEVDRDWRTESRSPSLNAKDKRDRLAGLVGRSMAADTQSITSMLSRPETKIFALELDRWSTRPMVD
ncbi:hypothetical protein ACOI1H_18995, partial [Loktanella sp. DJP18]|uniref:hypothetical protein n=1 Tax=Loktanella sp. DJP18 TaxID=3409788 RepID=UPI003BB4EF87